MVKKFDIVKKNIQVPIIDENGNLVYNKNEYRYLLEDENKKVLSNKYHCMIDLGNDHFGVCDVNLYVKYFSFDYDYYDYYDIIRGDYRVLDPKLKWGVIRVNRSDDGEIIPYNETLVFPYLYDEIRINNSKTVSASSGGKFTYLDLDVDSEYYGMQLVPCVLGHALPFNIRYEGFAQCSINGKIGFLPRNCCPREYIQANELLTSRQVSFLLKYLNSSSGFVLSDETIDVYFNLTGERLAREKVMVLSKRKSLDDK